MKRSLDIRWAEVRVGIVLFAALAVAALAIFTVGEKTRLFAPTARLQVLLPNVQGLKVGAPVWLSGVMIGTVAEVAFTLPERSDQVTVTLQIDTSALPRVGSDAVIAIRTRGLLGEKYVDITPGDQQGTAPEGPIQGVSTRGVDEVMEEAHQVFLRLGEVVESLDSRKGTLGKFLQDPALYDNLTDLSARLRTLVETATEGKGSLARIIKDPVLYERMVTFSTRGEAAAVQFQGFVASLEKSEGTLGRLARDPALYKESLATVQQARATFEEFSALLGEVHRGDGTAGKLINDPALHERMVRTLDDLDLLVRDIRENPGRYVRLSLF